jgi:TnpA family transposase
VFRSKRFGEVYRAAIEGVVRHEALEIAQLAVDTHGHTDFAMDLAKLPGFDLCPRLKALMDRHLFLSGTGVQWVDRRGGAKHSHW